MPETDPYETLARFYDLEHAGFSDDAQLYLDFARRTGGPILELGCGTGRLLLPLARAGFETVGLDRSAAMLARAQARLEAAGLADRVALVRGDMTDFDLGRSFGLALLALNSFMHLNDPDQQLQALTCARRHLRPGGLLILDLPGPSEPWLIQPGLVVSGAYPTPEGGIILKLTDSHYERARQIEEITLIYDETDTAGATRRTVLGLSLRYIFRYELELLLRLAGLRLEAIYGDYDLNPYTEDAARMIAVASRSDPGEPDSA